MRQVGLQWGANGLVAGVDEAGRGPLVGPVMAAAVILDDLHPIAGLADSKQLTALKRERLFDEIRAKALCFAVAQASVEEIDSLNILQATLLAMRRAVQGLRLVPKLVLVDGNRPPVLPMRCEAIVKGDSLIAAISAASILAKVTRDRWCERLIFSSLPTALPDTRVMALRNIWRHCKRTVRARYTARPSPQCVRRYGLAEAMPVCSAQPMRSSANRMTKRAWLHRCE